MCGIFGFVGRPDRAQAIDLTAAVRMLRHRGPDGSGVFRGVARNPANVACALAHTRLAVVDLTTRADQPMSSADGRYTMVYNGEIYNFAGIRCLLEKEGIAVQSTGDTEVLLKSYIQWGASCVDRFRGMFVFAVWDQFTGRLFAARDRLGVKPLYYTAGTAGLAFSSELRPLLELGFSARRLSIPGLVGYLRFGSVPEPSTIVDDVRMLPAGHTLTYTGTGEPSITRFWDLPAAQPRSMAFAEAVEEITPVLNDAVSLRLVSDVPLGVFLSGGIDSSLVAGIAAAGISGPLQTFTVTFDEHEFSEAKWAAEVAEYYGCDHHQVHLPAVRAAAEIEDVLDAFDQPSADGVNTWFVSRAARQAGLTVALSGLGGDELFAGYGSFGLFRSALRLQRASSVVPRGLYEPLDRAVRKMGLGTRARRLLKLAFRDRGGREAYASIRCLFLDDQIAALLSPALRRAAQAYMAASPAAALRDFDDSDPVNLLSRMELDNYLKSTLLRDADVMSMAHGLEVRVPLVDPVLVEECLAIPGRLKLQARKQKPLLTAALPSMPASVLARPKMGFVFPLDTWLRTTLSDWFQATFDDAVRQSDSCLDRSAVAAVMTGFNSRSKGLSASRVWSLFVLVTVCKRLGISADPAGELSSVAARELVAAP